MNQITNFKQKHKDINAKARQRRLMFEICLGFSASDFGFLQGGDNDITNYHNNCSGCSHPLVCCYV